MATPCAVPEAPCPVVLAAGCLKRIHVNQHIIRRNVKTDADEPAITVQYKGTSYVARNLIIDGPSTLVQRMHKPLSCGARIWVETRAEVRLDG